jgi:hypothetical protein
MRFSRFFAVLGLGSMWCLAGCGILEPRLCDEQFDVGERYGVNLIELQSATSMFKSNPGITTAAYYESSGSCSGQDGLVAGSRLIVQGNGKFLHSSRSCNIVRATIEAVPPPSTIERARTDTPAGLGPGGGIFATADVSFGGCRGEMVLEIFGASADGAFSMPVPGEYPPVGVYRLFLPSEGTCSICDDNFAGQLTRE